MSLLKDIFGGYTYTVSKTYRTPCPVLDGFSWKNGIVFDEKIMDIYEVSKEISSPMIIQNFKVNALKQKLLIDDTDGIPDDDRKRGMQVFLNITSEPDGMRKLSSVLTKIGLQEGYKFFDASWKCILEKHKKDTVNVEDDDWDREPDREEEKSKLYDAFDNPDVKSFFPTLVKWHLWKKAASRGTTYACLGTARTILLYLGLYNIRWVSEGNCDYVYWDSPALCEDDPDVKFFKSRVGKERILEELRFTKSYLARPDFADYIDTDYIFADPDLPPFEEIKSNRTYLSELLDLHIDRLKDLQVNTDLYKEALENLREYKGINAYCLINVAATTISEDDFPEELTGMLNVKYQGFVLKRDVL